MKLKVGILGSLAAAAMVFLGAAGAQAQAGPVYFTPKLMYSFQQSDSFKSTTAAHGLRGLPFGSYYGDDKNDSVLGGGLAVGYDFGAAGYLPLRVDLEYLIRSTSEQDYSLRPVGYGLLAGLGNVDGYSAHTMENQVQTVMLNVYYDINTGTALTPYVGAGIGGAYVDSSLTNTIAWNANNGRNRVFDGFSDGTRDAWNLAWQVGGGVSYQLTDMFALDLSYRYSDFGQVESAHSGVWTLSQGPNALGMVSNDAEADLTAHEVILGLRISAF